MHKCEDVFLEVSCAGRCTAKILAAVLAPGPGCMCSGLALFNNFWPIFLFDKHIDVIQASINRTKKNTWRPAPPLLFCLSVFNGHITYYNKEEHVIVRIMLSATRNAAFDPSRSTGYLLLSSTGCLGSILGLMEVS